MPVHLFLWFLVAISCLLSGCTVGSFPLKSTIESVISKPPPVIETQEAPKVSPSGQQILPAPKLVVNQEVLREIHEYIKRDAYFVRSGLARREPHKTIITNIFEDEGIPKEIINIALIESGFRNEARSPVGAVGMWQFTKSTAKLYGLTVTKKRDQRMDVVHSTLAAARYFRTLYKIYNDWPLALAAYNGGPGAVNRALKRTGAFDFWTLVREDALCTQTSRFVGKFIAATLLVESVESQGAGTVEQSLLAYVEKNELDQTKGQLEERYGEKKKWF